MTRLLVKDVPKRLGCLRGGAGDIKAHRFFRGMDWDALARKERPVPWRPSLRGALDTSHFDAYDEDDRLDAYRDDELAGWDNDF